MQPICGMFCVCRYYLHSGCIHVCVCVSYTSPDKRLATNATNRWFTHMQPHNSKQESESHGERRRQERTVSSRFVCPATSQIVKFFFSRSPVVFIFLLALSDQIVLCSTIKTDKTQLRALRTHEYGDRNALWSLQLLTFLTYLLGCWVILWIFMWMCAIVAVVRW